MGGAGEDSEGKRATESQISESTQPWMQNAAAQAQELQRKVAEGTDQALKSARFHIGYIHDTTSETLDTAHDLANTVRNQYNIYEGVFFDKLKEGVWTASEHPNVIYGVGLVGGLLLMRTPRRFLFRNTIGRFRTEEQLLSSAEKQVKEMRQSVELLKNESKKLEERAKLAEEELQRGRSKLLNAGTQLQSLVKSVYKTEGHGRKLMDDLRELPGREALRLRAEVASMTSEAKQQRSLLQTKVVKIANYGISV